VYDHALPIPYSEDTPRGFYWGDYARHKIAAEDLLFERHRAGGGPITIVRPTHVMGPLNTRNNETFFMDRIWRERPVLVPGHGGWLRQFGHVEDLAIAMAAMLGNAKAYGQAYNVMGEDTVSQVGFVELIAEVMNKPVTLRHFDPALLKSFDKPGPSSARISSTSATPSTPRPSSARSWASGRATRWPRLSPTPGPGTSARGAWIVLWTSPSRTPSSPRSARDRPLHPRLSPGCR